MIKIIYIVTAIILISSCNKGKTDEPDQSLASNGPIEDMDLSKLSDLSVYNLDAAWTTQDGDEMKLGDLAGKLRAMAMVYTSCPYACPRIVADIQHIASRIPAKYAEDIGFVLVTLDTEVDTPGRLKAFALENNLKSDRWTLLHGRPEDVLTLAALVGVKYKKTTATDFAHSNLITILNRRGEVVHQQNGLGTDPAQTVKAIEDLLW